MLIARLLVLLEDMKQKRCERCRLQYDGLHEQCPHCSGMNDTQLKIFLEERGMVPDAKSAVVPFSIFGSIILMIIILLSHIIKT